MSRKAWPKGKTLPHFATYDEELAFWERYYVPWNEGAYSEAVGGPRAPRAAARAGAARLEQKKAPKHVTSSTRPTKRASATRRRASA
jgi:hypothetical protein